MINPGYSADPVLEGKDWFAGAMSREAAKEAIMGHPDGTFLVRTSTRHDGYSLSVKFVDQCRHVKVLKDGTGKYGFTSPCEYATIIAFVENFQAVSLSVYNAELETKLAYPYKTAPAGNGPAQEGVDDIDEELYATKRDALRGKMAADSASHYVKGKKASTYDTVRLLKHPPLPKSVLSFFFLFSSFYSSLEEGRNPTLLSAFAIMTSRVPGVLFGRS